MDKRGAVGSGAAGGERVLPELFMAQRKDDAWGSRAMTTKATDEVRPKARTTDCSSRSSLARTTNSWATSATFSRPPGTCGSIRAVNGLYVPTSYGSRTGPRRRPRRRQTGFMVERAEPSS
jgi:hypothetical protein